MKLLILGAGGMAGHMIAAFLHKQGHDVLGLVRTPLTMVPEAFPVVVNDVRDLPTLRCLIQDGGFDAVINAIGVLNQFAEQDPEQAVFLNAYLPHWLASVTARIPCRVLHMSTDCVFSGLRGGYGEEDFRDGPSFYDRSKALGEIIDAGNVTLRQSIIGPDLKSDGIGLFNWFMQQKGEIRGFTRALWTGVTTLELARIMEVSLLEGITGLHHMVPDHPISKYELLRLFQRHLKKTDVSILPYDDFISDKSLIRTRFDFPYRVPDYETMVSEMADWIRAHPSWYPHYILECE